VSCCFLFSFLEFSFCVCFFSCVSIFLFRLPTRRLVSSKFGCYEPTQDLSFELHALGYRAATD
jgi:hypothetical protein